MGEFTLRVVYTGESSHRGKLTLGRVHSGEVHTGESSHWGEFTLGRAHTGDRFTVGAVHTQQNMEITKSGDRLRV